MRVPSWARACVAYAAAVLLSSLLAGAAAANPAARITKTFPQSNGTTIELRLWGDEYANGWETTDGYTVIYDEVSRNWMYARLGDDGKLTSSGVVAGSVPLAESDGLRPTVLDVPGGNPFVPTSVRRGEASLDALPGWATGSTNVLVIMVQFPADAGDPNGAQPAVNATFTAGQMQANLFGATPTGPGNMTDYYNEISYNALNLVGTVVGPFTMANDKNDYDDGPLTAANLVTEAIQAADAAIDLSPFDNDGNGQVDMVAIAYAGNGPDNGNYNGANSTTNRLWPHASSIGAIAVDGGARTVSEYFIAPELLNNGTIRTIGVYAHEFGHKLGLPDLYDTDDSSDGLGHWCLMASGSWCSNNPCCENGEAPSHMSAWAKSFLGWVTPDVRTGQRVGLNVPQAETNSYAIQLLDNPGGNDWVGSGEYFLIENRQQTGFDVGLPGCGILVWHVDEAKANNTQEGHTAGTHRLVDLEEAGTTNLDGGGGANRGDAGDPFPGSTNQTQWDDASDPSAKLYSGSNSNQRMRVLAGCSSSMAITLNNLPPVADAGPDQLNVECTGPSGAVVNLNGTGSSDPDGNAITYAWSATGITFSDPNSATPSATFPEGTTNVTLTVSDGLESDTDVMQVRVVDTTPPSIVCPASITVECTEHGGTPASDPAIAAFLTGATASDVCGNATISNDAPAFFPHGTTTVTFTATDEASLTATCTADVTVEDTTPPTISVTLNRDALWPPNHKLSEILCTVVVEDICDPTPTFVLTSITSNEPDNGLGDGDTPNDIQSAVYNTADVAFLLRSERAGGGTGRLYTIIYTASDDDGNTARDTAYVEVPHSQAGNATAGTGFGADGASLDALADRFMIVIPTNMDQNAMRVDAARACLGNTQFSLAPETWWLTDVTGDRKADLVLAYSTARFEEFTGRRAEVDDVTLDATRVPLVGEPLVDDGGMLDGPEPIGLHYVTYGEHRVVDDVFALGTPLAMIATPPSDVTGDAIAPAEPAAPTADVSGSREGAATANGTPAPKQAPLVSSFDGRMLSLAQPGRVRFDVYNVLGHRVRTVVDGDFGVGQHPLTWDGTDASGRRAPNGIYFYRVTGPALRAVRKVSLVR